MERPVVTLMDFRQSNDYGDHGSWMGIMGIPTPAVLKPLTELEKESASRARVVEAAVAWIGVDLADEIAAGHGDNCFLRIADEIEIHGR